MASSEIDCSGVRVESSRDGGIATVFIDVEAGKGVLDPRLAASLAAAAAEFDDGGTRCVILTGTGRAFAVGADIREIESNGVERNLEYNRQLRAAVDAVAAIPVPTIAAINGFALGGGLELALACTFRVGAADAKLGLPEVRLGILPGTGGLARLPRLVGTANAARLLLTGEVIGAEEAERLGILDRCVPTAAVLDEARSLARRIASAAPLSVRAILDGLRRDGEVSIAEANARTEDRLRLLLGSADRREGVLAFLERRDPTFTGS